MKGCNMNERYDSILNEFAYDYPGTYKSMVSWYASGNFEITIVLEDGERYCYNQLASSLKKITKVDKPYEELVPSEQVYREEFSYKLRSRMHAVGITQKELSVKTGISVLSINKYVNAENLPGIYNLRKIATVLECSVSELVELY